MINVAPKSPLIKLTSIETKENRTRSEAKITSSQDKENTNKQTQHGSIWGIAAIASWNNSESMIDQKAHKHKYIQV